MNLHYIVIWAEILSLLFLALFGTHRLLMVILYLRKKHQRPFASGEFQEPPKVCIQIPIFNEWKIAERVIKQVSLLDYPKDKLEIQVLDDSNITSCRAIAKRAVENLQANGFFAEHIIRSHRDGFKAGALAYGVENTTAEFVAVFDADFLPQTDFLEKTINFFFDPKIDLVQCRWAHLNSENCLITRAEAALLDGHFQIEHTVRNRCGHFFNFNGTAGIWRKSAISKAGGWQGDTLTEDLDLSYRAQLAGSNFLYLLEYEVPAELPNNLNAFKSQQHRWTKGSTEVFLKLWKPILLSKIGIRRKAEAFFHLGANFCYPLLLLSGLLLLPAAHSFSKIDIDTISSLLALRVLFFLGFCSVLIFYFTALIESRNLALHRIFQDVILAIIAGIGLSFSNTIAVFEGVFGRKTPFVRTPKTGDQHESEIQEFRVKPSLNKAKWRSWLVLIEFSICIYFAVTLGVALRAAYWEAIPFSLLFFSAFTWFSYLGLVDLLSKLRISSSRRLASSTAE